MKNYQEILEKYREIFLERKNVVGVGYGKKEKNGKSTDEEAIVVLVKKKLPSNKLKEEEIIPQQVENYKTDVIEVGDLQLMSQRTSKMRPARPGISISHYEVSAGTLGAIVTKKDSDEPLILSNNHVLANITNGRDGKAEVGDPILQPGKYDNGKEDNDIIASLYDYVPIIKNGEDKVKCPVARTVENVTNHILHYFRPDYSFKLYKEKGENIVDCALARPENTDDIDDSILDIGRVEGVKKPEIGIRVQKSGRTSGLTKGNIKVVNTTVEVKMNETEKVKFYDQFITEPLSQAGDSGSLVLDEDRNAVGLLFAGSTDATVCNNIQNVIEMLEIEF
ncbi:MAG: hypothetical protein ACOCQ5_02570 [Halanaerobiales bacterium]